MRLTIHTDYALRTLLYLGVHTDRRVSIHEIARVYKISENHLVKVIHHLGKGGFLSTFRGRHGGLELARPADKIRIGDVVRYTEEEMVLLACMAPPEAEQEEIVTECILSGGCVLRSGLAKAMDAFMAVLDDYTLDDMLTPYERLVLSNKAGLTSGTED